MSKCLLILGGNGRTGRLLIDEALGQGLPVRALVRKASSLEKREGLTIIEGNPANTFDLDKAITGCSAVISVLNVSRSSDFPWAPLRSPKDFLSSTMRQLIEACHRQGIHRLVVCSAWGVGASMGQIPTWFRLLVKNSNIRWAYEDHERQEALIQDSGLSWTIIRPVGLTARQKPENWELIPHEQQPARILVSRRSLAMSILRVLSNRSYYTGIWNLSSL